MSKLTSGRFILAIMAGFVFIYISCKGILPTEAYSRYINSNI